MTFALVVAFVAALGLARRVLSDAQRLQLIAEAEHELRGPLQVIALAAEADARRGPADARGLADLSVELERARVALADLAAARSGRRSASAPEPVRLDRLVWRAATASDLAARRAGGGVHLDWSAGPITVNADRGRLAQALGNLLANAVEHGGGQVRVVGRRTRRGIRVEVRDSGRGHGLAIAAKAVRDSGGTLKAARAGAGTAVAIELPIAEGDAPVIERPIAADDALLIERPIAGGDAPADPPAAA
jgi:signal transduction histidine kinase